MFIILLVSDFFFFLFALCFIPQLVHFAESHVFQRLSHLYAVLLDIVEAAYKLPVREFKGSVGVEMIESACVDHTEEEVAKLAKGILLIAFLQLHLQFAEFFPHLVPHVAGILPVEAHIARLVLYAVCFYQRG